MHGINGLPPLLSHFPHVFNVRVSMPLIMCSGLSDSRRPPTRLPQMNPVLVFRTSPLMAEPPPLLPYG